MYTFFHFLCYHIFHRDNFIVMSPDRNSANTLSAVTDSPGSRQKMQLFRKLWEKTQMTYQQGLFLSVIITRCHFCYGYTCSIIASSCYCFGFVFKICIVLNVVKLRRNRNFIIIECHYLLVQYSCFVYMFICIFSSVVKLKASRNLDCITHILSSSTTLFAGAICTAG